MKNKAAAILPILISLAILTMLPQAAIPAAAPTKTPTAPALTRTLKLTSPLIRGEDVRLLQERLLALGYSDIGSADGIFGQKTDAAVRKFQSAAGLTVDGLVGPRTWQALFGAPLPTAARTASPSPSGGTVSPSRTPLPAASLTPDPSFKPLKLGDFTSRVDALHKALINLGYLICNPTGDFSWQTELAVKAFQRDNGLEPDGVVGQATWAALTSKNTKPAPQPEVKTLHFNPPFRLEKSGNGVYYEDNRLLVIFSSQKRLARMDTNKGIKILKYISLPNIGTAKDPWGKTYPLEFYMKDVTRSGDVIWLGGRTHFGAAQGVPAVMAIDPGGKLLAGPFQFGGLDDASFLSLAQAGKETLAFYLTYSEGPSLWSMDVKSGLRRKYGLDIQLMDASASASDGSRIWLSLPEQGHSIVPLNPSNGTIGALLGTCGKDLAYDGTLLWVLRENEIAAYNPATGQIQARAAAEKGFTFTHIAARPNQVAVLAIQYSKPYLLILNH